MPEARVCWEGTGSVAMEKVVIVGAGHAGVELAYSLRQNRFAGSVILVSDEVELPYQRPPLSKDFLKGDGRNPLLLKGEVVYSQNAIDLRRGRRALGVDRLAKVVHLDDGEILPYDHLALALGARNRRLRIPGADHPDVLELRTLEDTLRILAKLPALARLAIIGGGFIGLEIAAGVREKGIAVDIIEMTDRLMGRAVSLPVSDYFRRLHENMGATIHFGAQAESIEHLPDCVRLHLEDGRQLTADAVLVAAGVVPNTELAAEAGLATDNGIVVDGQLLTGDPSISAIGDCVSFPCKWASGMVRLESVQNAVDQARCVAKRLTANAQAYANVPWFWSNQGAARLQIAGLIGEHDSAIMRGDVEQSKFSVFLYRGDRLLAVESVNSAADHLLARKLIEKGVPVPRDLASRPEADLKALAA
jgi:3-phenylpropionate/trans-cinnamate dioxygenase ferredoxin reductase subunit